MKIIRRKIACICPACWGLGTVARSGRRIPCPRCDGTGSVDKFINEIVYSERMVQP